MSKPDKPCAFEGCDRVHRSKGYCAGHANQLRRGDPMKPLPVRLPAGSPPIGRWWVKVRATPYCWIWTGYKLSNGYGRFGINGKLHLAHRFSYEHFVGPIPDGLFIDHKCRNRACVNPGHLQVVTRHQNLENRVASKSNKLGIRGVSFDKQYGKYLAKVMVKGREYFVGRFNSPQEAEVAVIRRRNELCTNNIQDRISVI